MAKSTNRTNSGLFYKTFAGEFINIYTSLNSSQSMETEEGGSVHTEMPLVIKGYLLDKDDEYYYLGDTPKEVNLAIRIDEVKFALVSSEVDLEEPLPIGKELN